MHVTAICDMPEYRAFEIVLKEESKILDFTYILTEGAEAERFIEEIERSDIIFLSTSDVSPEVEKAVKNSQAEFVFSTSGMRRGNLSFLEKAEEYFLRGGIQNIDSLLKLSLWACGKEITFPDVLKVPWHGIYHPRAGVFTSLSKYLWEYPFSAFSMVGLVFSRRNWLYGQVREEMEIVGGLEARRLGVIPVFTQECEKFGVKAEGCRVYFQHPNVRVIINAGVDGLNILNDKPIINCTADGVRVRYHAFPGFSEKFEFDEGKVVDSAVRWTKIMEKVEKGELKVGACGSVDLDFDFVEPEKADVVLDTTGKCNCDCLAVLTPDRKP